MDITVKQVSSLEKIRPQSLLEEKEVTRKTLMGGQRFSYQIALRACDRVAFYAKVTTPTAPWVTLSAVVNVAMDLPTYDGADEDYITKEPGLMPDLLLPLADEKDPIRLASEAGAIWVTVEVPENTPAGIYPVTVELTAEGRTETEVYSVTMELDITGRNILPQKTLFTQWFHVDCIAQAHHVEIYSEAHWERISQYMALARKMGINMILTPVITPPLDTAVGTSRPITQLVKIEKKGCRYEFDFSLLKRWIDLCNYHGFACFEISHLFSQWGLAAAPNITVTENGEEKLMFGWHIPGNSPEYRDFLGQFLPSLVEFFKAEGIKDRCWFHISDEPRETHLEAYRYARDVIVPLIDGCPTLDALSDYAFYEQGLVPIPVTKTDGLEPFLENRLPRQWAYYCCSQFKEVGNRFLAQPSYRNRILGLQLYKYGIEGFLHWGFNFYNSRLSLKQINPFITSSADKGFPSGDAFSVYPTEQGPAPSLRAVIFREALEDIEVCRTLEGIIGRDAVVTLIDREAGEPLTFRRYPRNSDYIPNVIEKMQQLIRSSK